jgi:hypothetical protein
LLYSVGGFWAQPQAVSKKKTSASQKKTGCLRTDFPVHGSSNQSSTNKALSKLLETLCIGHHVMPSLAYFWKF